jgi:protein-S-isoprenylcysteine O-methyltransferase Ste14
MASLRRSIIVSILFAVFGGPGLTLVYLPFWITRFRIPAGEPWWKMGVAAALVLAGIAPLIESIRRFIYVGRGTLMPTVPTEHLVLSGFYRHVRNPMYVGVMLSLVGEAILFESRAMIVYLAIVALAIHLFICSYEEPTLSRRYGEEYLRYKRHVPRWLPRLSPWNGEGE